jgi:dTDP-4-dehydrorhamnose 3,5-epimerase
MKCTELRIPGVWLIEPDVHADSRGSFRRHFCAREFHAKGMETTVAQGNISENIAKGTLRGFHYQVEPHDEAKTISCLTGAIYNVVLDLRALSPTFLTWDSTEISARNHSSLYVPAGCANAWLTTEAQTILHYYMSKFFVPEAGRGIRYNDPLFAVRWPSEPSIISERDRSYPDFDPRLIRPGD